VATVTINDAEPPTATITAPATADEGGSTTLTATAADPDNDATLTYQWTVNPAAGVTFADPDTADPVDDPSTLLSPIVNWPDDILAATRKVAHTLTLTVTDSQGLTGAAMVTVTVLDKEGVPQANAAPPQPPTSAAPSTWTGAAPPTAAAWRMSS